MYSILNFSSNWLDIILVHSLIDELIGYLSFDKSSLTLELHVFFFYIFLSSGWIFYPQSPHMAKFLSLIKHEPPPRSIYELSWGICLGKEPCSEFSMKEPTVLTSSQFSHRTQLHAKHPPQNSWSPDSFSTRILLGQFSQNPIDSGGFPWWPLTYLTSPTDSHLPRPHSECSPVSPHSIPPQPLYRL